MSRLEDRKQRLVRLEDWIWKELEDHTSKSVGYLTDMVLIAFKVGDFIDKLEAIEEK